VGFRAMSLSSPLCKHMALLLASFRVKKALQPRYALDYVRHHSTGTMAPVTKVEKIILDNIKATGPISFASYMQLCLSHPTDGYYMNPSNAVFGSRGDFTTSPEISQVFGEVCSSIL